MTARSRILGALAGCALLPLAFGAAAAQQRPDSLRGTAADRQVADTTGPGVTARALGSRAVLSGRQLRMLPIDDARQALQLVPGVVLRGTDMGVSTLPDVTIRGTRGDQTAIFVDGAPARFELFGTQALDVPLSAIAELDVETGVRPAAVAEGGGAALGYRIHTGGSRLEGGVAVGGEAVSLPGAVGYTRFEAHAGGPLPVVPRLTFFLAGSLQGQPSEYRGAGASGVPSYQLAGVDTVVRYVSDLGDTASAALPRFAQVSGTCGTTGNPNTATGRAIQANYGYDCRGLRRPLDWGTSRRAVAKVHYPYGNGSSVSLTGLASDFQRRYFPGSNIGAPGLHQGARTRSLLVALDWSHRLGSPGVGGVVLTGDVSYGSDESLSGPLDPTSSAGTASPAFGIAFSQLRFSGLDVVSFPHLDATIRDMRLGHHPLAPYEQRTDLAPYSAFRSSPYGVYWPTDGISGTLTLAREHRLDGRFAAEWTLAPAVRLSAGADASRTDVAYYQSALLTSLGIDAFVAHPSRIGVFASARYARSSVLLEAGVRADRFDAGADYPNVPGRIFTNPAAVAPPGGDTSYAGFVSRVFTPSRARTYLSPRVGLAFRMGPRTTSRLAYGEQVARPPLDFLYSHTNTDILLGGTGVAYGRDVRLAKTSLVELAVRHAFAPALSVDLGIYAKTNAQPYGYLIEPVYDPLNRTIINLPLLSAAKDHVFGADARLEWRSGPALSGSVAYSYSGTQLVLPAGAIKQAEQTTHALGASVALEVPEGWRRGSWLGALARGVRGDLAARAVSGSPYTRAMLNQGLGTISPDIAWTFAGEIGGAHLPWTWLADLRLSREFDAAGARWAAYLEVRNLLNAATLVAVFTETGTDVNARFRDVWLSPAVTGLQAEPPAGVLGTDGTIDLTQPCSAWRYPADCVALQRVENRFGDGDGHYTAAEQQRAFGAWYESVYGTWRFHGPARTARLGVEVRF